MGDIKLGRFIDKNGKRVFLIIIAVFMILLLLFAWFFYIVLYQKEKARLDNGLNYFFESTDNILNEVERNYNLKLESNLNQFYDNYNQVENHRFLSKHFEEIKEDLINLEVNDNLRVGAVNYYFLSPGGNVVNTDYGKNGQVSLSRYPQFWNDLRKLTPGEVLLTSFDDETLTGKLRLSAYLRLPEGYILEICLLFEEAADFFKNRLKKIEGSERLKAQLLTSSFKTISGEESSVSEGEIELLKRSAAEGEIIKKDISLFRKIYYKGWHSNYGNNKYIKVEMKYCSFKLFFIIIWGITLFGPILIIVLNRYSQRIIDSVVTPISLVSKDMKEFSQTRQSKLKLANSNIKEINNIIDNYTQMVEEINASYGQLEAYNQQIISLNEELEFSYQEVNKLANDLEKIISFTSYLGEASVKDEEEFLSELLQTAIEIIPEADYGSVYRLQGETVQFVDTIGHDLSLLQELEINGEVFDETTKEIRIVDRIVQHTLQQVDGLEKRKFKKASKLVKQSLTFGLFVNEERLAGISLDIAKESKEEFSIQAKRTVKAFKTMASAFYKIQHYNKLQSEFKKELILSITKLLEIYDEYTNGHSESVAEIAQKIAEEMKLEPKKVKQAYWTGLVHDIGKILVPIEILNKPERLTEEEYEQIKLHSYWGYLSLGSPKGLGDIARYVLYHHERWDGKGYPEGLEESQIPLISQIVTIADSWNAMRSKRSYREPLSKKAAIKEIKRNKGVQFAPEVVDVFLKMIEKGKVPGLN